METNPSKEQVNETILQLLSDRSGIEPKGITDNLRLSEDLAMDSLDTVEFIMELETNFKINIHDEEAEKVKTVGDAKKFIIERLNTTED